MKFMYACVLMSFLIIGTIHADEPDVFQIEIEHPSLRHPPKPLMITVYKGREPIERYKWWPMIYDRFSFEEGEEHIVGSDDQWDEYYDAFFTLDKEWYVLVRKRRSPEWSQLIQIEYRGQKLKDMKGERVFWSKDGKYLVTVSLPSPFFEAELALYFYNIKKRCMIDEVIFDDAEKMMAYIKDNLISAETSEDIESITIPEDKMRY